MRILILIALVACGITVQKKSKKSEPSIAVIGAGFAGLSTARRLTELGLTDVTIFEGSDRIGGRVHAIPYDGGYLQMGAQFINGKDNPIYRIAKELGVVVDVLPDDAQFTRSTLFTGNQHINQSDIDLIREFTQPLELKYRSLVKNHEILSRVYTIQSIFMEDYENFLKQNNIVGQRRNVMDALIRPYKTFWEFEWGGDWSDMSPRILKEFDQLSSSGDSYTTNHIGFKAILDKMTEGIDEQWFRFNHTITNINYSNGNVILNTKQFGTLNKTFDYVVITSSLGHLKKFHEKLFTPRLPRQKIQAINKIGFGGVSKIFFRWDRPFWTQGTNYITLLPVAGLARKNVEPFEEEMNTLECVSWSNTTLMAFIAGKGQKIMDEMEDSEISERITKMVRDMTEDETVTPPDRIIRTRLTKNDLLLGSYTYMSASQAQSKISNSRLAIPVKINGRPRVLFAGEATHHRLFQTTVGAFLSGRREADRIWKDSQIQRMTEMISQTKMNCEYCKQTMNLSRE